ncbi:hypothetical protein E2C01_088178 [Portunus trituberculatus]|uniref:Uncharacterized protein n=1 Tax=Portunus trituberculatus TaxID=210409 RepID=A0A5B7JA26_PORTR|nr:hypothetical protein [Portunus trituberculatus]
MGKRVVSHPDTPVKDQAVPVPRAGKEADSASPRQEGGPAPQAGKMGPAWRRCPHACQEVPQGHVLAEVSFPARHSTLMGVSGSLVASLPIFRLAA